MKTSLLILSFLFGLMSALKHQTKLQKLAQSVQANAKVEPTYTCTTAIENFKKGLYDDYRTIIANGVEYNDSNFTASPQSLQWANYTNNKLAAYMKNSWNRLSKINANVSLYGDDGFTHDIDQGQLGNCYFLGGLSSIGEDEDRIKKVFINEQRNSAGIYAFNVFIRGIPTIVTVDEQVPVSSQNKTIFSSIGSDNSIWGPLLEKAWAKVNGNFERTEGGFGLEPIGFLTNFPARRFRFESLNGDSFYRLVEDNDSNKFMITLGISGRSDQDRCNLNLPCKHLYSLLDVQTVYSRNNQSLSYRLYKFRNPWRIDAGFTGKWNDSSPMWKADGENYDEQAGHVVSNDGIMWIEESEVFQTFTSMNIAWYEKDWQTSWYNRENDNGTAQNYFFTLEKDTFLTIKLDLYSTRMYSMTCKTLNQDNSTADMKVDQLDSQGKFVKTIRYVALRSLDTFGWVNQTETALPAGKYRVMVQPTWLPDDVKDYTLAILSNRAIEITDQDGKTRQTGGVDHDFTYKQ